MGVRPRPDQEFKPPPMAYPPGAAAGIVRARQVIIIGSGGLLLVYSPSAGAGNLIESIAGTAGTDPYGNAYLAGETTYGPLSGGTLGAMAALNLTSSSLQWSTAASFAGPWTVQNTIIFDQSGSSFRTTFNLAGLLRARPQPGGLIGNIPGIQTPDSTSITVTQTVATRITKAWSIPANDAQAATTYRLTAYGFGTNAATPVGITASIGLNGAAVASSGTHITNGNSAALRWQMTILLHVLTTGAGGTADLNLAGGVAAITSTGDNGFHGAGTGSSGGQAFNTTVANDLELMMAWSSTTGAPSLTCIFSVLERLGP